MERNEDIQIIQNGAVETDEVKFYKSIADLIRQAQRSLKKSVNTAMVVTYYKIG